jgi:aminopeptidase N
MHESDTHGSDRHERACAAAGSSGVTLGERALSRRGTEGGGFAPAGADEHFTPDLCIEPVHLSLRVRVDVLGRRLAVQLGVRLRARSAGAQALALDGVALQDLTVERHRGRFSYDGRKIQLWWDEAFASGEERELLLSYGVHQPVTGVSFSAPTPEYPDASTFAVTDHETERARYWLASLDHPSVRPTLDLFLRADERFTLLANGEKVGEQRHEDGTRTVHFSQALGCPSYLTCFAVGDFVCAESEPFEGIPIAAFVPKPFGVEHAARTFGRTRDMLAFITRRLGVPYPFAKYYQFAAEGIGGAMENISLVSWDDRFLLDELLESEERDLIDAINIHEMAHTWFGDHVVCRDFAHSWLKEGWATYIESCWHEEQGGQDALDYDLWNDADHYFAEVDERYARPIVTRKYDSSFDLFDRHLYSGAALRIHMLRRKLGDEVFWRAVREYLTVHAGRLVETDDFRRILEAHSGISLEQFFQQWFERPGFPDLEVSFRHDPAAHEGVFEIVQKRADEKTGEGSFRFELEIACGSADAPQLKRVSVSERRTLVVVSLDAAPEVLRIDPNARLLHRLDFDPGAPVLLRQLVASDARGRIQAGVLLMRHAGRIGAEAIRGAFETERFWGVRIKWAEALGRAASEAALQALLALSEQHADPKSLAPLLRALGKYRDPRVSAVLSRRLDAGLPYRAAEAALEALGAQREAAPLERLLAAAQAAGFGGFVQSGALRALGATRRGEALEPLLDALRPGRLCRRVRPAAADGLGALAATLPEGPRQRAIEALIDALRDPSPKLQLAAAHALGRAKAHSAAPALEALAQTLARQDAARVRRVLRRLSASASEGAHANELEQLHERLRKLAARVEELEARSAAHTH